MKIITINLSLAHVKALQMLQDLGLYPSRSEAIRVALRDFLMRNLGFVQTLDNENNDHDVVKEVDSSAKEPGVSRAEIARLLRRLREDDQELSIST